MSKYNITERKDISTTYQSTISPDVLDRLHTQILDKLLIHKKFMDPSYTAKELAKDLNTNTRYVSAVCNLKFHTNYSMLVNKYRIDEAMSILVDRRYLGLTMEEVAGKVGFTNRQSFYGAFYRMKGCTPRDYKIGYLADHPELKAIWDKTKKKRTKSNEGK